MCREARDANCFALVCVVIRDWTTGCSAGRSMGKGWSSNAMSSGHVSASRIGGASIVEVKGRSSRAMSSGHVSISVTGGGSTVEVNVPPTSRCGLP